jgi:hypothetical protein
MSKEQEHQFHLCCEMEEETGEDLKRLSPLGETLMRAGVSEKQFIEFHIEKQSCTVARC